MKAWSEFVFALIFFCALIVAGITFQHWWPSLVKFAGTHSAEIEGLSGIAQGIIWVGASLLLVWKVFLRGPFVQEQGVRGPDGTRHDPAHVKSTYLEGLRREHGSIRLYGFQSVANINVKTLDVFVSLRLLAHGENSVQRVTESEGMTPEEALRTAVSRKQLLLIMGDPGSGKTTLMKYLALNCDDANSCKKLGLHPDTLPIFMPLMKVDPEKPFVQALSDWATTKNYAVPPDLFESWLREKGALVLLDGLDEISDKSRRRDVCKWIDNACHAFTKSQFVVTTRFAGYRVAQGIELEAAHLQADVRSLSPDQQKQFLERWFRATYADDQDRDEPEAIAKDIVEFLKRDENRNLRSLAGTPMLLQIMAILRKEFGSLAEGRTALYQRVTDYLLDFRDRQRDYLVLLDADRSKMLLRPLALKMQEVLRNYEIHSSDLISFFKNEKPIEDIKPGLNPEDFVENLCDRTGLLQITGNNDYRFAHKSFGEFLAGVELAGQIDRKPSRVSVLIENFDDDWWRETVLFTLGLPVPVILPHFLKLFVPSKANADHFPLLLRDIIEVAREKNVQPLAKPLLDRRLKWQKRYNVLECLRLIRSSPAIELIHKVHQTETNRLLKSKAAEILAEFGVLQIGVIEPAKISLSGKLTAKAEVLARGTVLQKTVQNPFEFNAEYIRIPGGKYSYSVDGREIDVPSLYFAKYPVTNRLYRRFIDFLEGKKVEEISAERDDILPHLAAALNKIDGMAGYAGADPKKWPEKFRSTYDNEKRFNGDDQPVVGCRWYGAKAYCAWLNELHRGENPEASAEFRLPAEQEWEWAASGGKRDYPWGPEPPDESRANYGQKVGQTTPVGSYPAGATPDGLMDMAGNVWEWMENWYDKDKDRRALRGGSWDYNEGTLRCSVRYWNDPDNVWHYDGFRVVLSRS